VKKSEPPHVGSYRVWIFLSAVCFCAVHSSAAEVTITKTNYHGWPNSYVLCNGTVEAIVVSPIGRVMQFRFVGEESGPFFENRAMDGKHPIPRSSEWGNFGGDKTWPAPQDDWPKVTPRAWPPPAAFDSMAMDVVIVGDALHLVSPVDPNYGIRAERILTLGEKPFQMTIETIYHKVKGEPCKVSVWTITQLNEPEDVCVTIPGKWNLQSAALPLGFKEPADARTPIHLKRDPVKATKIGTQADSIFWHDKKWVLSIRSARINGAEYPDKGSSAEIYTNPNPLTYVELEMLGPLKTLNVGDMIAQTNVYSLGRRAKDSADDE
jgi:hypothetical protein